MKEISSAVYLDFLRPSRVLFRKCNFGLLAGKRARAPSNLVQFSANWATEAVAESLATGSLFMRWAHQLREENTQKHFGIFLRILPSRKAKVAFSEQVAVRS